MRYLNSSYIIKVRLYALLYYYLNIELYRPIVMRIYKSISFDKSICGKHHYKLTKYVHEATYCKSGTKNHLIEVNHVEIQMKLETYITLAQHQIIFWSETNFF